MLPTHRRPPVGWIVLVVVIAAVLAGAAYGLHRITARVDHKLAQAVAPPMVTVAPDLSAPMTLAGIPLRPDELPAGWTAVPLDPSSADSEPAPPPGCEGLDNPDAGSRQKARTEFRENGYLVASEAQLVATEAEVRADVAKLQMPEAPRCLRGFFRRGLLADIPSAALHALRLRLQVGSNGGPSNVVATIDGGVTLTANGRKVRIYVDFVMIAGDRVESSLMFMRAGLPVDPWLRDPLVAAVAERTAQL
jgi:hypothetical protein